MRNLALCQPPRPMMDRLRKSKPTLKLLLGLAGCQMTLKLFLFVSYRQISSTLYSEIFWGDWQQELGWSPTSFISRTCKAGSGFNYVILGVMFQLVLCYKSEIMIFLGIQIISEWRSSMSWCIPELQLHEHSRLWSPTDHNPNSGLAWRSLTTRPKQRMDVRGWKHRLMFIKCFKLQQVLNSKSM